MKFAILLAGLTLTAVPAHAEVVHQTSIVHNGQAVAVTYQPKVETSLRQIGIGPRANASCLWTSSISVQRTAQGADGRTIAALTRVIAGEKTRSGQRIGHCATLTEQEKARFSGSEEALRAHVLTVAERDTAGIHAELASLSALGAAVSHAR